MTLAGIRPAIERFVFPELERISPQHRARALEQARAAPFDLIEILGILLGVAITTALTHYGMKDVQIADRLLAALANFAIAVPLLAVLAGPFLIRRTRRGLREFIGAQRSTR
jgi:hypothetical protein